MSPDSWLEKYYSGEYFSGDFAHLKKYLNQLDLNFENKTIITVAGTNGKGETSRYINYLLNKCSSGVALWTSPHLLKVNERFVFNNLDVDDVELLEAFDLLQNHLVKTSEKLSYFEFLFISFLILAKNKDVDYLILEVGLGGRLDAVNILDADIVVLTSISRDHVELLGNSYEKILKEKLGVLRAKSFLISGLDLNYLNQKITHSKEKWLNLASDVSFKSKHFSNRNKEMAFHACHLLFSNTSLDELEGIELSRRLKFRIGDASFTCFPSHNVDGVRKLVQFLDQEQYTNIDRLLISFSERKLDEIETMIKLFLQVVGHSKIMLFSFDHFKAIEKENLRRISEQYNFKIYTYKDFQNDLPKQSDCIVTGSNYFLADFYQASLS